MTNPGVKKNEQGRYSEPVEHVTGFTSVIKKATELPTAAQPKLAFQPNLFGEKTCRAPRFLSSANLILQ